MAHIDFNKGKALEFKKAYEKAVESGKETFWFEDQEIVVDYAKYMLEYLSIEFGKLV
jgi:hypothetical protein